MKDPKPGTQGCQVRPTRVPGRGIFILPCWPNGKLSIIYYTEKKYDMYITDRVNI